MKFSDNYLHVRKKTRIVKLMYPYHFNKRKRKHNDLPLARCS